MDIIQENKIYVAVILLVAFLAQYFCANIFPAVAILKTKKRNRININVDHFSLRINSAKYIRFWDKTAAKNFAQSKKCNFS